MELIEIVLEQGDFKDNVDLIKSEIKEQGVETLGCLVLYGIVHGYKQVIEQEYKDDLKKGKKYSVSIKGEGAIGDAIYFETAVGCSKINTVEFDMPYLCKFGFSPEDVIRGTALIGEAA